MEAAYLEHTDKGVEPKQAAALAGYYAPARAAELLQNRPALEDERRLRARNRLRTEGVEAGVDMLIQISRDPKQPAGARVAASIGLIKLGGLADDGSGEERDPSDMTGPELQRAALKARMRIEVLERARADAAQPLIEGSAQEMPNVTLFD
jgi:hypothetical protein